MPTLERASSTVSDVFAPTAARCPFARHAAEAILSNESLRRLGAVVVATDGDGRIRGVLTIDAIGRALRPQAPDPGPT